MISLNSVNLVGTLSEVPQLRAAGSTVVAGFTVALERRFRDRTGQDRCFTDFFKCEVWGTKAELMKSALAGAPIAVNGSLKINSWTGKDGAKHRDVIVNATDVQFGDMADPGSRFSAPERPAPAPAAPAKDWLNDEGEADDLPF